MVYLNGKESSYARPQEATSIRVADQLAMLTYKQTAKLPKDELFGLVSQMRRSAVSVASNIVEVCSRSSTIEYVRSLRWLMVRLESSNIKFPSPNDFTLTARPANGSRWQPKPAKSSMDSCAHCEIAMHEDFPSSSLKPHPSSCSKNDRRSYVSEFTAFLPLNYGAMI